MQSLFVAAALLLAQPEELSDFNGDWLRMRPLVPLGYVCGKAAGPIAIDGRADEPSWQQAPWTEPFVDIEADKKPAPRFATRAKMLWDDRYFYVHAELEEPHVWGALTKKNEIIFHDNDFEVFIDPDGDNHNYYEFEMNALNTIWELTLAKPYWDGGPATHGTNLDGLKSAVQVRGTLNNPADTDRGWSLEIAFPWQGLAVYANRKACPPRDGDLWRVNFSRVEWLIDIIDGKYRKVPRNAHPEDNWVWSPQGLINMHRPERWGYVQFSTSASGESRFQPDATLPARDLLMEVYHRQRAYMERFKSYAETLDSLQMSATSHASLVEPLELKRTSSGYQATARLKPTDGKFRVLHVRQDSKLWEQMP